MIKAVLFDMGGTIADASGPPKSYEIQKKILQAHGIKRSLKRIIAADTKVKKTIDISQMADFEDYWVKFDLLLLKELEVHENTLEVAKAIDKEWWNYVDIKIYPDVLPILHILRDKSIKLGVVSNCLKRELEQMLDRIHLKDFFDLEVGIDTFRRAKPDKEIFLQSVEKLKVSLHEALFVGDSTEKDYKGAKNAGVKALLIDREHKINSRNIETIRTFNELLEHI